MDHKPGKSSQSGDEKSRPLPSTRSMSSRLHHRPANEQGVSGDYLSICRDRAHAGIMTAVEGVETQTRLDVINAEGFDEAQRYLFARPLTAAQLLETIRDPRG